MVQFHNDGIAPYNNTVVTVSIILYIICVVTNKPEMTGYYLILYYCTLFECHTCHLNQ